MLGVGHVACQGAQIHPGDRLPADAEAPAEGVGGLGAGIQQACLTR